MKKIVITRPLKQAQDFALRLIEEVEGLDSHNILLEPLLSIEHRRVQIENADHYDGVIITSSNAIAAAVKEEQLSYKPFYCVGTQTAEKLKRENINNVVVAATVSDLMKKIKSCKSIRLLYFRGEDISFDIKKYLQTRDIIVDEVICYEAHAATEFSPTLKQALEDKDVGVATFFSKRTAEIFVRLLGDCYNDVAKNPVDAGQIQHLCISQPVLEYLRTVFSDKDVILAKTPDMKGMLDAVNHYLHGN